MTDEQRTSETVSRLSEIIAAQSLPVCLVVTGDDLSESLSSGNENSTDFLRRYLQFQMLFLNINPVNSFKQLLNANRFFSVGFQPCRNVNL